MPDSPAKYRLWNLGQQHLVAGRYIAARQDLVAAERLAWRDRDAPTLARIHLPLLEARRQIRYQAAEGHILIARTGPSAALVKEFLAHARDAGTLIFPVPPNAVAAWSRHVTLAAIRSSRRLELLILSERRNAWHLAAPAAPYFAAGLPVQWTTDPKAAIGPSADPALVVPLPPPMKYDGSAAGLGTVARESILIAWEALALRWQHQHPPGRFVSPWEEMAWLRQTLQIDPACEPVAMRLMAVAEGAGRIA